MTVSYRYRQRAHELVDKLPDAAIVDLLSWMQSKRTRQQRKPYFTPVPMGGLWKGIRISDEDITGALALGLPLISKDERIQTSGPVSVIW
jgi:hypothetical protein